MSILEIALNQLLFSQESALAISLYGCKRTPSLQLCSTMRNFFSTYGSWPALEELIIYQYTPCREECECALPMDMAVPVIMYGVQEYGVIFTCRITYLFHLHHFTEGRYPRDDEILSLVQDTSSDILTDSMHQQVDEFWNKQKTDIDLSKFPSSVLTEDCGKECAICQEPCKTGQGVVTLSCDHMFHTKSDECGGIQTWLERCNTCPLCKKVIE